MIVTRDSRNRGGMAEGNMVDDREQIDAAARHRPVDSRQGMQETP